MIKLGETIRALRLRDGRTQETLALALGVTSQAVSRWEKGVCCPDLELIPSIAHYFGVSIDELFGYDSERSKKEDALARKIREMIRQNNGRDVSMDACVAQAREALIEFPGSEKLTLALASALYTAGYVRHGEHHLQGEDGCEVYDTERHRTYTEWQEAVRLLEKLLPKLNGGDMRQEAVLMLSQLYRNIGAHDRAMALAESAPDITASSVFLRINAFDGGDAVTACGEALLETVLRSTELMETIVRTDRHLPPQTAADMLARAMRMFDLVCTDHVFGRFGAWLACLHMLRSYYLWLAGDRDGAFAALDAALACAGDYDRLREKGPARFSSPLLPHVKTGAEAMPEHSAFRVELPEVWPWWCVPGQKEAKAEMQSDPRWDAWVRRTKE